MQNLPVVIFVDNYGYNNTWDYFAGLIAKHTKGYLYSSVGDHHFSTMADYFHYMNMSKDKDKIKDITLEFKNSCVRIWYNPNLNFSQEYKDSSNEDREEILNELKKFLHYL